MIRHEDVQAIYRRRLEEVRDKRKDCAFVFELAEYMREARRRDQEHLFAEFIQFMMKRVTLTEEVKELLQDSCDRRHTFQGVVHIVQEFDRYLKAVEKEILVAMSTLGESKYSYRVHFD